MWQGDPGVGKAAPLTRDEAEALRDVMFEQAGDDPALGIARSWALRRILGRVNKRLEIRGQDPAPLGVFRRPVDNAFVPGMMAAVRQGEALRDQDRQGVVWGRRVSVRVGLGGRRSNQ